MGQSHPCVPGRPSKLHGPYWPWDTEANGKTVNRHLRATEAEPHTQWSDNDRPGPPDPVWRRQVASQATALLHDETSAQEAKGLKASAPTGAAPPGAAAPRRAQWGRRPQAARHS